MKAHSKIILIFVILFNTFQVCFASQEIVFSHIKNDSRIGVIRQIIQDNSGMIWIASTTGFYTFDGNNYHPVKYLNKNIEDARVISIDGLTIWMGSGTSGLYFFKNGKVQKQNPLNNDDSNGVFAIFKGRQPNSLWIGTDRGLFNQVGNTYKKLENLSEKIIAIEGYKDEIFLASKDKVFSFNVENQKIKDLVNKDSAISTQNNVFFKDNKGILWLGKNDGLYKYLEACDCFESQSSIFVNKEVTSISDDGIYLWVGTLFNGIFKYNVNTNLHTHYKYDENKENGLIGNNIKSVFVGKKNLIWYGTFRDGIGFINYQSSVFGRVTKVNNIMKCALSSVVYRIISQNDKDFWIATENGLIHSGEDYCQLLSDEGEEPFILTHSMVHSLMLNDNKTLWIGTVRGINKLNIKDNKINQLKLNNLTYQLDIIQILSINENELLLGTDKGLFSYSIKSNKYKRIFDKSKKVKDSVFYNYSKGLNNDIYWGTTKGLALLSNYSILSYLPVTDKSGHALTDITALAVDSRGGVWFGADYKYLYYLSKNNKLVNYNDLLELKDIAVMSILIESQNVWLSTKNGLYKINPKLKTSHYFSKINGLQDDEFQRSSKYISLNNLIYFGGKNGFNYFNPKNITNLQFSHEVVLTDLKQLNNQLNIGDKTLGGFKIEKDKNWLDELILNYKDYSIEFEFAALDYLNVDQIQYGYRLKGFQKNWVYTDANNRQATYTNLKPGDYTFQVKAANKDGIWTEKPKELKVKVYPAPWLSPWAYALYALLIMISIWSYIRYKTITSRKRALVLERTVAERTQEVVTQKKMVESLLDHKNEVFANITHEFKTPISLILGPVDQLTEITEPKYVNKINMIQRNAQRLMLMVGQILKLSQSEQDKEVIRESQSVKSTLLMLFESFTPLAQDKNITLTLKNSHDVNVYATSDCLEMVVGNLLSNAMKFTNIGGEIKLSSQRINNAIYISVEDTGSGIQDKDLRKIFKRFTRLETHKSIAGTGIGLAVVKEVTEANDGAVKVESQWGKGSIFTLQFPITEIKAVDELSQDMVDQLVDNTANELTEIKTEQNQKIVKNRFTVLIIEDNLDMQSHIGSILKSYYNCLFADRGKTGIALALKEVPDIIICDVMMPEMDGYQVTRILRHDGRTSHIPIVLLTALNTKESRIKGWRENIDTYITKPFDAIELKVQLENILNIRKLLQQKTNKAIKSNDSLNSLDLTKQDLKFIDKLKDVIASLYANEYIQKADIASKMAVSERQLQRKIKALIDENPMDMLRDYRLEKAAMKLKDGYQVGIVSDACGFSSVSYFGSCFKKKYGVTPKQYQGLDKK